MIYKIYFLDTPWTILCPQNDTVDDLNFRSLDMLQRETHTNHSADSVVIPEDGGEFQYPTEYLNTINGWGLPLSKLKLKIGAPLMALWNPDPSNGMCNGTHAILTQFTNHVLEVRILGGDFTGKTASIPRITIILSNLDLPFDLKCQQFPVRIAFAMSINKSQGQSVKKVGWVEFAMSSVHPLWSTVCCTVTEHH